DLPPCGDTATAADFETAERNVIVETLRIHHGRVTAAARALHVSRATLYRKIKALKIGPVGH
ncbi:MAG: HTH domain-containing protein, partial [Proteobacteria bacterium]|nr:HTH domain-containing protein [Pseudomonadota bacterium]